MRIKIFFVVYLQLMDELQLILTESPPEEITDQMKEQYTKVSLNESFFWLVCNPVVCEQTIEDLQHLLLEKVDLATLDLLVKASDLMDSETMNLEQTHENSAITLCLWGNLVKNPRLDLRFAVKCTENC